MKLFFKGLLAFLLCTSFATAAETVLVDFQKTDLSKVNLLGGATLTAKDGVVTFVTKKVGTDVRTYAPSGLIVSGNWDLTPWRSIVVELSQKTGKTIRVVLKLENAYVPGKATGVYLNWLNFSSEAKEYPITMIAPSSIMTFGMRRGPWDVGIRNTLEMDKVSRILLYTETDDADVTWTLKRIVATDRLEDTREPWLAMNPAKAFPFIDIFGQFMFNEWPNKVYSDADLKDHMRSELDDLKLHPGPKGWDQYGGWADGPRYEATGQFYVKKISGKWWFIDPEGYLYWSHGPVRVTASSGETPLDGRQSYFSYLPDPKEDKTFARFYDTHDPLLRDYYVKWGVKKTYDFSAANLLRKYGMTWRRTFDEMAHVRLKSWGMNTIANSSDESVCLLNRTPYSDRIELKSPAIAGSQGHWWPFRDPFHPAFKTVFHEQLMARSDEINNPWCFGFFVDNELNWGGPTSLAVWTLQSPADQPAKIEFVKRLKSKYGTVQKLNAVWKTSCADWNALLQSVAVPGPGAQGDLESFSDAIIDAYFKNVRDEFKKVAPNKVYMGCRFSGFRNANERAVKIAARYCDVISTNVYRFVLDDIQLPEGIDKPLIIGEFHFGALDRGLFHHTLVGVDDQKARGKAYYNYVESALRHPNFIGVHWHQYGDQATTGRFDGEDFQNGLVDVCDTPYQETINGIREIGYKMYEVRALAPLKQDKAKTTPAKK
ncbi:MAG: hypothetical protein PHQ75_06855 [Thermoguttaceae bacterium]|nr:hypothetical protein [Thermoguttaceae bacterium]